MNASLFAVSSLLLLLPVISHGGPSLKVMYAVNCGGEAHTDSNGFTYKRDPLMGKIGTASDYGKQLDIQRAPLLDKPLYQTERYHHSTFGYDIPVLEDGDYVLILKFSEVYFDAPNMKASINMVIEVRQIVIFSFCTPCYSKNDVQTPQ